jgi:hypothetical protein
MNVKISPIRDADAEFPEYQLTVETAGCTINLHGLEPHFLFQFWKKLERDQDFEIRSQLCVLNRTKSPTLKFIFGGADVDESCRTELEDPQGDLEKALLTCIRDFHVVNFEPATAL